MKLFFHDHHETYAIEQTLLMLFPAERPSYPDAPAGGDNEAELFFFPGKTDYSALVILRWEGKTYAKRCSLPAPPEEADEVLQTRLRRRILQRTFYLAAVDALGFEPPWGMLSGVRPVKLPVRAVLGGASLAEVKHSLREDYHVSPLRTTLAMDCAKTALRVLADLKPRELSLYVGIPFCPTRCAYCSFISSAGNANTLIPAYLEALHAELESAARAVRQAGLVIRSVYLGGGTPTILSAPQLTALLAAIHEHFPLVPHVELTVEAGRPDTITREKLLALQQGGATRLSINPQTLSDAVLQTIGRAHSVEAFHTAWALARELGFDNINADLIAGLPGDEAAGFEASLNGLLALSPENVTVHTLALKRGSRLVEEGGAIPSEAEVATMLELAWSRLRTAGYVPYYLYRQKFMSGGFENVAWTKPGKDCIYNICMMEELHSVLSLGAGGVSKLVDYQQGSLHRQANPKYPQEYIRDILRLCSEKETLFANERINC